MNFEIQIRENMPLTTSNNIEEIAKKFLDDIGIISLKDSSKKDIFILLLKNQEKYLYIDDLTKELKIAEPTVYLYLNKFRQLQILEELSVKESKQHKKGYRLRFGNLSLAWKFTEIYVEGCLLFYKKAVENIQKNFVEKKTIEKQDYSYDRERRHFSIRIIDTNIDFTNPKKGLIEFLVAIGYMQNEKEEIPLKIFEYFLKKIDKPLEANVIAFVLKISQPTVYRHLNNLLALDILDRIVIENKDEKIYRPPKKLYRIRYANILKAWNFTEAHVKVAMENYRKTVEHLQELAEKL